MLGEPWTGDVEHRSPPSPQSDALNICRLLHGRVHAGNITNCLSLFRRTPSTCTTTLIPPCSGPSPPPPRGRDTPAPATAAPPSSWNRPRAPSVRHSLLFLLSSSSFSVVFRCPCPHPRSTLFHCPCPSNLLCPCPPPLSLSFSSSPVFSLFRPFHHTFLPSAPFFASLHMSLSGQFSYVIPPTHSPTHMRLINSPDNQSCTLPLLHMVGCLSVCKERQL